MDLATFLKQHSSSRDQDFAHRSDLSAMVSLSVMRAWTVERPEALVLSLGILVRTQAEVGVLD